MVKNMFFMLFNPKKSLFARLFLLLMAVFTLALLIITAIWNTNINKLIYKNTLSHITDIIKTSNNTFEDELKNISVCTQTIASVDTTVELCKNGIDNSITTQFSNYISGYYDIYSSNIYGIAALDTQGSCFSTGLPYIPDNYTETEWFKEIISKKGKCCFILRDIYGQKTPSNYLTVGCAVMNGITPVGVILIDVRTSLFIKAFGMSRIGGATRTLVIDNEKNIIFCNDIVLKDSELDLIMQKALDEDLFNKIREIQFGSDTYMLTAQKSSYTGWTNITFFKKHLIDEEYKTALRYTVFCICIVLLLTLIIASVISVSLSKKINRLVKEIESIDLGNLEDHIHSLETNSQDEIGIISSKVSVMSKTILSQFTEIQTLAEQKRISDIKVLKSQINPHFLYNTLNVIENLANMNGNTAISNITKSLIDLLHYSVNDGSALVPIENEIDYIRNYLEIMQIKFLGGIKVAYDVEPDLTKCLTLKMILQPVVENCIKHALTGAENEYILIKVCRPDDDIEIKIIDNGKGIPPEKLGTLLDPESHNAGHLGLSNVNQRIKLSFGDKYGLSIFSVPKVQTAVIIKIPFITE